MTSDRLVLDTNVFVSGLIWPASAPGRVMDLAVAQCRLLASRDTLDELVTTLLSARFDPYLSRADRDVALERLIPLLELAEPIQIVRLCRDPKDDKFLEAALNGRADVLVSGDKDLLVLNPFSGIAIVTPADYLARVAKEA